MTHRQQSRPIRFLLVEDDDDHADLVRRAMRGQRIANGLQRVANGQDAMSMLRRQAPFTDQERPDVVLLDLKLPGMNGLEVLESIKEDPELRSIPVVILTTSRAEADRQRAYHVGANSYLVKPVEFDQFQQMVHDLNMYWAVWNEPFSPGG